jgi:hypothetical protein
MNPNQIYTEIYNCSWASDGTQTLKCNVRGDSNAGGFAGFSEGFPSAWTSIGHITDITTATDAEGEHITVSVELTFSHIADGKRSDFVPATAVFTGLNRPDGTSLEGVKIEDTSGNVLASTPMLPVVRGSLNIIH